MTPEARHQAAIEILDDWRAGREVENALTTWARGHRFAGSKDRAAIRDLVFDVLRCLRSCAHLGGGMTGRALVLGLVRRRGMNPAQVFSGQGHAPAPLSPSETAASDTPLSDAVALDCPDWLLPLVTASLGDAAAPVLRAMQERAPVHLRVNLARTSRDAAIAALAREGIVTRPHPLASTALQVTGPLRGLRDGPAFAAGLVELQDAASQAVICDLPDLRGRNVLDYCAGGGGKALALAALGAHVTAHDAKPARMHDLPARAARAGGRIQITQQPKGTFDLVLTDVPCSGSGSWRRDPAGKWRLTPDLLVQICDVQADILAKVAALVVPGGHLAYVTCSILAQENGDQIARFLSGQPDYRLVHQRQITPLDGGDGFFLALMQRG
jgi:16S rRNA (cytosine967-C5)-methyltransferase